jgi:hypothetical protein
VTATTERLVDRWPAVWPSAAVAGAAIVAGGIVAAVSRPTDFGNGPWLAAYLVLVVGVAQALLAGGQAMMAEDRPSAATVRNELLSWNLGAAAVVAGTLVAAPVLTTIGGIVTAVALVLFLLGVRRADEVPSWVPLLYRALVVIVLVSVPIGLVLAWVRH